MTSPRRDFYGAIPTGEITMAKRAAKIDNQDLAHQREKTQVNDTGTKVPPPLERQLEREDEKAEKAVRKFEESLTKLPPG
jgi:hypothetical protein